jgi:hypothetical protein
MVMTMPQAEREAYAAMLEQQASEWRPLAALTLSYNVPVSAARIQQNLSSLHTHIDRELLGSRFYKRQPHERSRFWAVVESMTSMDHKIGPTHRHVHAAWKVPPPFDIKDLDRLLNRFWLRFAFHGSYDVQEFRFHTEHEIGWGYYSTKFLTETDNIIESADFLRS